MPKYFAMTVTRIKLHWLHWPHAW